MATIGVAGLLHETNTFAAQKTTWQQFVDADAWPGLLVGKQVLEQTREMNIPVSGFIAAMAASKHHLAPLVWASAGPSGIVEQDAFERYWTILDKQLQAHTLDALFLDLHGAMVTEQCFDAEGELLQRLRQRLGSHTPIVCALDFHANISPAMTALATLLIGYRYYPHTDMAETGGRCAEALQRLLAGKIHHLAQRHFDFLISLPWQATDRPAMQTLVNAMVEAEQRYSAHVSFFPGFPLADVPFLLPRLLVYADDTKTATSVLNTLSDIVDAERAAFNGQLYSPAQAIDFIRQHPNRSLLLADTQDNPGGGADSDGTDLIHALREAEIGPCLLGLLCDPLTAKLAHSAGQGATLDIAIGAKHNQLGRGPVPGPWRVQALSEGAFTGTGPFYRGCAMQLGLMAVLAQGNLRVVVSSRAQQAADQAMFRHLGIDPLAFPVLVLKSSVHFRADFAAHVDQILIVAAPGRNTADLSTLDYRHCPLSKG